MGSRATQIRGVWFSVQAILFSKIIFQKMTSDTLLNFEVSLSKKNLYNGDGTLPKHAQVRLQTWLNLIGSDLINLFEDQVFPF